MKKSVKYEWETFTDAGEDFDRDTYQSIVEAVDQEIPELRVEYTLVNKAVESYRELENQ